jgi:ornithine decarboxylase
MSAGRQLLVVGLMLVLAMLDFAGALPVKAYADRHQPSALIFGCATFAVLFVVYALALHLAELSIVTMGWIVLLQVGLITVDVTRNGLLLGRGQWVAAVLVIVLQGYLVATAGGARAHPSEAAPQDIGSRVPTIALPAQTALVNKTSASRFDDFTTSSDLVTPFLVVDLDVVAARYRALAAALPQVDLHYAVKANPAPEVLRTLRGLGAFFDVASPAEIVASLDAGAQPGQLSYGNTVKKERDIEFAFERGVRTFSFDSDTELDKLIRTAPGATLVCRLATSGDGADWSLSRKFGCSPDTAGELLLRAAGHGHATGLCFHVGSQQRDPLQWRPALAAAANVRDWLDARGVALDERNLGGGFPASYRDPTPPIDCYGHVISGLISTMFGDTMRLTAEPGRFLVADAGILQTEVVLVAERGGRRWVHLDIGLFGGLAEAMDESIKYRITTTKDGSPTGPVVLAGPTCDSVDVLYQRADYRLPLSLRVGDVVTLHATGAYTATYASMGFNGLAPLAMRCLPETMPATHGHRVAV